MGNDDNERSSFKIMCFFFFTFSFVEYIKFLLLYVKVFLFYVIEFVFLLFMYTRLSISLVPRTPEIHLHHLQLLLFSSARCRYLPQDAVI